MLRKIANNRNPKSLAAQLRRKRFLIFQSLLSCLERPIRILDVGGTEIFWKVMGFTGDDNVHITLLNLSEEPVLLPNFASVVGDAREIKFPDASFDVIFSNSVIEHVGQYQDQRRMAEEVRRVGKRYFVQTPNKYFPIEPHFLFPFFQFLPVSVRVSLIRHFNLGWIKKTPDYRTAMNIVEGTRLLSKEELLSLFPGASLHEEKIIGITKSFVAYGGWEGRT
jgi:hypothetical protein